MKIRRIVVGVDFREPSVAAARWTALELAPQAEIVLVHAVDLPKPPRPLRGVLAPVEPVAENAVAGARARLANLGPWVDGTRVVGEVATGHAAECLIEAVDTHGADLLVVADHGERRGVWEFLGTTAERVIQRASVPVLVARGLPEGPPRRILAAVDDSSVARRALRWAVFLGRQLDAKVVPLHALEPVVHAPIELAGLMPIEEIHQDLQVETGRWLKEEAREAGAGSDVSRCQVRVGEPVHEIFDAIQRERADLVVIGSRGAYSPIGAALGGVARAVLREAVVPVLVVGPLGR
jgi:nucleotide-binding universal stress UspA family protein